MWADTVQHRRIDRYMLSNLGARVTVAPLPASANADFDTARCAGPSIVSCWALAYDDGTGHIHKLHFSSMGYADDGTQAGATPHYSPDNSQLLYRLQSKTNFLLKVDSFSIISRGTVKSGVDWRP